MNLNITKQLLTKVILARYDKSHHLHPDLIARIECISLIRMEPTYIVTTSERVKEMRKIRPSLQVEDSYQVPLLEILTFIYSGICECKDQLAYNQD